MSIIAESDLLISFNDSSINLVLIDSIMSRFNFDLIELSSSIFFNIPLRFRR